MLGLPLPHDRNLVPQPSRKLARGWLVGVISRGLYYLHVTHMYSFTHIIYVVVVYIYEITMYMVSLYLLYTYQEGRERWITIHQHTSFQLKCFFTFSLCTRYLKHEAWMTPFLTIGNDHSNCIAMTTRFDKDTILIKGSVERKTIYIYLTLPTLDFNSVTLSTCAFC